MTDKSSVVEIWSIGNYSTDYMFYQFQKIPVNELAGVVVSLNGKLYCHEIKTSNSGPSAARDEADIFHISPANISSSPISVQVTNVDNSERFTVFYKTDQASDKFLNARLGLSDAGSVIYSEPIQKTWTTNGFRFCFNTGYVWPFKFKIIEAAHDHQTAMVGVTNYWFYLRDFATNDASVTDADRITKTSDGQTGDIRIPGLNASISFTEQPRQFTLQMPVATYRDDEQYTVPTANELHRQAWLLRPDGTSIPQWHTPLVISVGNGGFVNLYLVFTFQRNATNEVGGIVVSVNGKLFSRELSSDWNKP